VEPVPEVVTLHVWRVPRRAVPAAVARMALDRRHLASTPGLRFAKGLGTGDGRTFTVRDADPTRWALLCTWTDAGSARRFCAGSPVVAAWGRIATETCRLDLEPLAAHGSWSGRTPFGRPRPRRTGPTQPVVALTRARLVPARARGFWRAVPPVSADLQGAPGLRAAIGVGEAPVGLQGTVSVWDSAAALKRFAYDGEPHAAVVARTRSEGWYAEELFARFAVRSVTGTLDGVSPL
jgi:hypothetical protein